MKLTDEKFEEIKNKCLASDNFTDEDYNAIGWCPDSYLNAIMQAAIKADRAERNNEILERINEIKRDERLSYDTATVFENAPLALIQCSLTAKLHVLESLAGLPLSKTPLPEG